MNSNVDVLQELKKKNKEIYLNKLIVDVDSNSEILEITINNMINLFTEEMINKLSEIYNKNIDDKNRKVIINFQEKINNKLINLIHDRAFNLKNAVNIENNLNYKQNLDDETNVLIEKITKYYKEKVGKVIDDLSKELDSFSKDRIVDYFHILYYERLINKLKEILLNTNLILFNNYQVSLEKYDNMNKKALSNV